MLSGRRPPLRPRPATEPPRRLPSRPTFLAVDLGTGGPKVAVARLHRRDRGPRLSGWSGTDADFRRGGRAVPDAWWDGRRGSARRALADSAVAPRHLGVGCTAQWSGTVPVGPALAPPSVLPSAGWTPGADAERRAVEGRSRPRATTPSKSPLGPPHRGHPQPSGKDPVGHIHFLREQRPEVYAAKRSSSSRSITSTCASPGWPAPRTTPSPCTG